ncbi:MAG: hypothetical protein WBE68_07825 [Candidatus Nitrosopolaris sp.]
MQEGLGDHVIGEVTEISADDHNGKYWRLADNNDSKAKVKNS